MKRLQTEAPEKRDVSKQALTQPDTVTSNRSPAVKRAGLSGTEGGGRRKGIVAQSAVRLGGGQCATPTLALVEVLVSKNRKLAVYKKSIRELR